VGNDLFGNFLIDKLKNCGINTNGLVIDRGKETRITINLSYSSDKYQAYSLNLVRSLNIDEVVFENIKKISHVHFTSYYMMNDLKNNYVRLINCIKENYPGVTFSLDTNDDPEDKWHVDEIYGILKHIKVFLINEREALKITNVPDVEDALNKLGEKVDTVVIKLGDRGYIAKHGKDYYSEKPLSINFIYSTGAGDNFGAGFIPPRIL
jgi:sugar/nucleoside kinase (ribokinase family)